MECIVPVETLDELAKPSSRTCGILVISGWDLEFCIGINWRFSSLGQRRARFDLNGACRRMPRLENDSEILEEIVACRSTMGFNDAKLRHAYRPSLDVNRCHVGRQRISNG